MAGDWGVASSVFAGGVVFTTFVKLDVDDDKITVFLSGFYVSFGFFGSVEIGSRGVVGSVTTSREIITK